MHITALKRFSLLIAATLLLSVSSWADYKRINKPNPDDPLEVALFRLDNGLLVYLTENHETPRFYTEIAVRAGSKHDPAESTGLAHYLEHLLFKGSDEFGTLDYEKEQVHLDRVEALYEEHFMETDPDKRKAIYAEINAAAAKAAQYAVPNEMDRIYNAVGGAAINAHTWHEETVYKVGLPANRLRQWAALESERFADPVFRLFQTELETVYEELNRSLDSKSRIISYAVEAALYKKHPYGQQHTIGKVEHLKNPSLKNIGAFYDAYYVPNNMAIFISGDIETETAIEVIDEYFSGWERKRLPRAKKWREKDLDGRELVIARHKSEEYVLLAFRTEKRSHRNTEVLSVLDMILDNAAAGLINLNLNQQQRVRAAGSYPQQYNDYGAQYLWGIPKDGQTLDEVEQLLLEQLEIIKRGDFDDWLIPAIVTDFKKNLKRGQESDFARVSVMRDSWLGFEKWDDAVAAIERIEKVAKKDVMRAAKKYFGGGYVAGHRISEQHELPNIEKPELARIDIDPSRESDFGRALLAMPVAPIAPVFVDRETDFQVEKDARGRTLYYSPNPLNDLFSFSITVEVGTYEDNTLSTAAQLLGKSGTAKYSAEDLKKEWYKLGSNFGLGSGDNETRISLSGLDENFEASLDLMFQLLSAPSSGPQTLEEMKKIILAGRSDAKKQATSISAALEEFNRYGGDSAYLRMLPEARLNALSAEQLYAVIGRLLDYKHTISYTGSLPLPQVKAALDRYFPLRGGLKDPPPYRFRKVRTTDQTEVYFFDKEEAKSNVRLEFGSVPYDERMNPAVQLYNSYFAGSMSGIVFQELREARALAYSAGARYIEGNRGKDQNRMVGAIQTQADKTLEATEAFVELLENLPESPDRFSIARDSIINRYRTAKIGFRGVIGAVRSWEKLGLEVDPRIHRYATIQESTIEDMLSFHKKYIAGKPKLISIVGDKSKIDMERLRAIGAVEEIRLEQIFVD